jgi:hypothetical protein
MPGHHLATTCLPDLNQTTTVPEGSCVGEERRRDLPQPGFSHFAFLLNDTIATTNKTSGHRAANLHTLAQYTEERNAEPHKNREFVDHEDDQLRPPTRENQDPKTL